MTDAPQVTVLGVDEIASPDVRGRAGAVVTAVGVLLVALVTVLAQGNAHDGGQRQAPDPRDVVPTSAAPTATPAPTTTPTIRLVYDRMPFGRQ